MSMVNRKRSIETFRLPVELINRLIEAGFKTIEDIEGYDEADLAKECGFTCQEALLIINSIKSDLNDMLHAKMSIPSKDGEKFTFKRQNTVFTEAITGLDHMSRNYSLPTITTFNEGIDLILSGGIRLGRITEFCGVPGIGKTQMGIQLAVNTFIPREYGGCEGRSIYIDTEGSFIPERAIEVAAGLVDHLNKVAARKNTSPQINLDFIMENMLYYRVLDKIQQIALIGQLSHLVPPLNVNLPDDKNRVRCIVIDTISFHFRGDQFTSAAQRNRLLSSLMTHLSSLAIQEQLAIVILNQVSTKKYDNNYKIAPVLEDILSHAVQTRILLRQDQNTHQREALILKSCDYKPASAYFSITCDGIR